MKIVYLLHFESQIGRCAHYMGITEQTNFHRRMRAHSLGYGARLTRAISNAGINQWVARIWRDASFETERKLKQRGHFKLLCPICRPELRNRQTLTPYKLYSPVISEVSWRGLTWSSSNAKSP